MESVDSTDDDDDDKNVDADKHSPANQGHWSTETAMERDDDEDQTMV